MNLNRLENDKELLEVRVEQGALIFRTTPKRPKYYIEFPILFDCDLRCFYCFHKDYFQTFYSEKRAFSVRDYCDFRDRFFSDAEEIIVHMHGGEPFLNTNSNLIVNFIRNTRLERIDLLSNGLQDEANYRKLVPYRNRVRRIGFTFHRKMIANIPHLVQLFEENVLRMKNLGFDVYVKELLFVDIKTEILQDREYWVKKGIPFKIQDYKGSDFGKTGSIHEGYTPEETALVDQEYFHLGDFCSCQKGYKSVLIRGTTWRCGDVLGCWHDPKVVGNIQRREFDPSYRTFIDRQKGRMDVLGVPSVYYGTFDRDMNRGQERERWKEKVEYDS